MLVEFTTKCTFLKIKTKKRMKQYFLKTVKDAEFWSGSSQVNDNQFQPKGSEHPLSLLPLDDLSIKGGPYLPAEACLFHIQGKDTTK